MTGMPELGSKISLISKADIRYEGRLFTVDPQECTIALANGESKIPSKTSFLSLSPWWTLFRPFVCPFVLFKGFVISFSSTFTYSTLQKQPVGAVEFSVRREIPFVWRKQHKKKLLKKKRTQSKMERFAHICKFASSLTMPCVCKASGTSWSLSREKNSQRIDNNVSDLFFFALHFMPLASRVDWWRIATVRSFGTEERETPYPIMPQPTVYDYILFRGSDIKDIRVVNNVVLPNDPAIMQMHLPPQPNNFPQQSLPQFAGGPPQMNQFANFGPMQGGPMGPNMPLQSQQQQAQSPIQSQHQGNNNSNLAPGSGSGHKNKKSSESNKKEMTSEKSATVKSTGIRKQSNKSQGVHRSLSITFSPLPIWNFIVWSKFDRLIMIWLSQHELSLSKFPAIGFYKDAGLQHVNHQQHRAPSKLIRHLNHLLVFSCTSLLICFLYSLVTLRDRANVVIIRCRFAFWNSSELITQVSNIWGQPDESEPTREPIGQWQRQATKE